MQDPTIPSSTLQRRHERFHTQALVWWQHELECIPLVVCDVSDGGLLCEFNVSLKPGERVALMIEVPKWNKVVHVVCSAAHIRQTGPHIFLIGLQLIDPPDLGEHSWVKAFMD